MAGESVPQRESAARDPHHSPIPAFGRATPLEDRGESFGSGPDAANDAGARAGDADRPTVLWIDDVTDEACVRLLSLEGFQAACATTGASGLAMARAGAYDAYIIDLHLPDMYGLTVLERLAAEGRRTPALVLTGWYTEPESEALARRLGAVDFRRKPIFAEQLAATLKTVIEAGRRPAGLIEPDLPSHDPIERPHGRGQQPRFGMVAASRAMRAVVDWVERVAPTGMPVLLTGETGTGKELVARALHEGSTRAPRQFVPVNCRGIPDGLFETELFGHRRGAFTGAVRDKKGLLEEAAGGTLFLDEIGDMALPAQVELLRFLEDGEVRRLGDTRSRKIDVRVIAATNRSLVEDACQGRFRKDLYFRLAVARLHLPSLRERPEDVEALIAYWLPQLATTDGRRITAIDPGAVAALRNYSWPGNVRELRNVLEYAVSLAATDRLTEQDVSAALPRDPVGPPVTGGDVSTADAAHRMLAALEHNRWNRTRTARVLGVNRSTLWRRLRKYRVGQIDDH